MSTVFVVAPIVVANWPVIAAAVTSAIGTVGFAIANGSETRLPIETTGTTAEFEVENSEILAEGSIPGESIAVQKDGVTIRFSRDRNGALRVCVEGEGYSKAQLRGFGEDLVGRVTQQYAYHRMMEEMKKQNMTVIHEEVDADRTVRIRVKSW